MANVTLEEFIGVNREELIQRCREKVEKRSTPLPCKTENDHGVPRLLDQVVEELRNGQSATGQITKSVTKHGHHLLPEGFSVGQVVHGLATFVSPLPSWRRNWQRPSARMTFAR